MSTIHLAAPDGTQSTHDESQARELWSQGAIAAEALYWRDGMPDWRPAAEFFGAHPTSAAVESELAAPPVADSALPPRGFVKDPKRLTKVLIVMLWISLGMAVLSAFVQVISLATGHAATPAGEELRPLDLVLVLLGLPQILVYIVTGVVFLMWIYRAHKNARGLGAQGMEFTAGWCVGWYFVPIFNLWKPYQAMKEIWQASKNPGAWRTQVAPSLLAAWWSFWIIDNILGNVSFRLALRAESPDELMASAIVSLISELTGIVLCVVAIRLVRSIYQMQSGWAAQPRESRCAICNRPVAAEEMVFLNRTWVCARCKPIALQGLAEGAGRS